jgi:predicted ester cyclase/phosphohistidine phosphatase SixA
MKPGLDLLACATAALASLPLGLAAQTASEEAQGNVEQVSTHMGEMTMTAEAGDVQVEDALRFEPFQQIDEMFFRDDVVYLMRHGPTDWSHLDMKDVAPTDCGNQRVMIEEGMARMRDLGTLLAANEVLPSRIVTSQWCRNQQTVDSLLEGVARVDPQAAKVMPVETDPELNLLLSLQGAKNTTGLRERVEAWDGDPERDGPLLVISHYTNIEELTQFRVFEGEILVLDPDRDLQVLGYVRLRSAKPDVGHFQDALESQLLSREQALDMVDRYYEALNTNDEDLFRNVLADGWVGHGESPSVPDRDAEGFLGDLAQFYTGLDGGRFEVGDVYLADDVITVRGTISGRHAGPLFGVPATGREVAFGTIAVHRVEDGAIAETWQMADFATLMRLITEGG